MGAGFGGLHAAKALRDAPVDVTLIDANNFHLFQPLLYQVAIAGLDADDIAYPTRGIVRRFRNVTFRLGRVQSVDPSARTITLTDGATVAYDRLVLAAGAVTNTFGVPGADEHAFGMKSLTDAEAIRRAVLRAYEKAASDVAAGRTLAGGALDVAIVGGGPTGVELAGGMHELVGRVLARDFPTLDVAHARITLVEATDRVLGAFTPKLAARAAARLEKMGVTLALGTGVAAIEPGAVVLADGRRVRAGTIIWAAGVKAGPLAAAAGLPLGRGGRIVVDEHLRVAAHPDVFAVGDLAASLDEHGNVLPQLAQVAMQGGRHAGTEIAAELAGRTNPPFRYKDKGTMATIGRHAAVAQFPNGRALSGPVGWAAWLALHLVYLIGFRNRANVLVNWSWNYLTYDHASLLIDAEDG